MVNRRSSDSAAKREARKEFDDVVLTHPDDYLQVIENIQCPDCGQQLWGDVEKYRGKWVHAFVCFGCRINFFDDRELQEAARKILTCKDV